MTAPDLATPGPWRVSSALPTKTRGIDILAGHARGVANVPLHPAYMGEEAATDHANAALIVRAVNSHAVLVAALEGVIRVADRKTDEFDAAKAALALARQS